MLAWDFDRIGRECLHSGILPPTGLLQRHGMDEGDRVRLYEFATTRPRRYYSHHPNSDRAYDRMMDALVEAPILSERLIGTTRSRRPTRQPISVDCPLNVRELQVLGGYASGFPSAKIADILGGISANEVRKIAQAVYPKLGITSRSGSAAASSLAVAIAIRSGWL